MLTKSDFEAIFAEIQYKDWKFVVGEKGDELFMQVKFHCPCSVTGERQEWASRKWVLSKYMCRDEVVKTAFKACETAEIHELRENFKWREKAIFGPHVSVEALWDVAHKIEVRD